MSVSVVSCLYGERGYDEFARRWIASLNALNTKPAEIIVHSDRSSLFIPGAHVFAAECDWANPQAFHLQRAITLAALVSEWVWILDMDDEALPDALDGLDDVDADVWQMGYLRSDGEEYVPPQLNAAGFLSSSRNVFTAGSAIRTEAFMGCGGFPDAAFQDWGLWRRLANHGATFETSGRAHYKYTLHERSRTVTELLPGMRQRHLDEIFEEDAVVA